MNKDDPYWSVQFYERCQTSVLETCNLWKGMYGPIKPIEGYSQFSKFLLLVPWKSAHSWRHDNEFVRTRGLKWSYHPVFSLDRPSLKEKLLALHTSTCFGYPLCLPYVNCMGMRDFTSNNTVHTTLPPRCQELHWLKFSRPVDNTKSKGWVISTLNWFNSASLSLVAICKGCSVT